MSIILEQMMDSSRAALKELDNARRRVDSVKGQTEDLLAHLSPVGVQHLTGNLQALVAACDAADKSCALAAESTLAMTHAVQNVGG